MIILIDLRYSIDISAISGKFNGGSNFSQRIFRLLCQNSIDNEIIVICREKSKKILSNIFDGINANYYECESLKEYNGKVDLLFIPQVNDSLPYAREVKKFRLLHPNTKIISTILDWRHEWLGFDKYAGILKNGIKSNPLILYFGRRIKILSINYALKKIINISDEIITISNFSMQAIEEKSTVKNITLVYPSIDVAEYDNKKIVRCKNPYILFVSAGRPEKNFIRSLLAFKAYLRKSNHDINLVATGLSNKQIDKIKNQKFWDKDLDKHVDLRGYVSQKELDELYSSCYFLLFTSLCEGFGLPALEASLHGTPCVLSRTTSIPEVIGNAAIYVNPKSVDSIMNGIKSMIEDYDFREQIAIENINILKDKIKISNKILCHEVFCEKYNENNQSR